ncbi:hypothetical protein JMJ77_0006108 [Colletotrichum scovillei]|uniref:Uncharacterized protein n=1 Tax=Colletotrichum scovillei TaxID=1209932 RepID=A0A9P7UJC7_9PEZI|nr:hypothetical protein JMJ77_0006108 [Colletotrichum scovillei]KAG7077339.1 hypothetical protein JMJ76_0014587 [Colletotrichum scovillei]KAG7084456.1 hypothetical protein JMJ78_0009891 [Colletotrichum scovillei]
MRSAAPQASDPASTPVEMQAAGGPGAASTMTGRSSAIVQMPDGALVYLKAGNVSIPHGLVRRCIDTRA